MEVPALIPGVLDAGARRAFTFGACGGLAIALAQHTGWPLVVLTDACSAYPPGGSAEDLSGADAQTRANPANEAGMGASGLHWLVLHPSGKLLDVDGLHDPSDVLTRYDGEGDADCDGRVALARISLADAVEEYTVAKGEPVPLALVATFVPAVLARASRRN